MTKTILTVFSETRCTYDLRHNFGQVLTIEKFNQQLIFYDSNIGQTAPNEPLTYFF